MASRAVRAPGPSPGEDGTGTPPGGVSPECEGGWRRPPGGEQSEGCRLGGAGAGKG